LIANGADINAGHGCPWDPETTYWAVINGHLDCLRYIYEHCGDDVSWEGSRLETLDLHEISEECQEFIEQVRDSWEKEMNTTGANLIKPAKQK